MNTEIRLTTSNTGYPSIDKPWMKYYDEAMLAQALTGKGGMLDSIDALMDDLHA